jgi:hypothetical protein
LEEILRLSLAFYICYLIVFEVHAVNASYIEDTYAQKNRELFESSNNMRRKGSFKL